MHPKVNQTICIGCGSCAAACPNVFKMGDDGKSHVVEGVEYEADKICIDDAIAICPVQAISWEE
jgi:ferredoxin